MKSFKISLKFGYKVGDCVFGVHLELMQIVESFVPVFVGGRSIEFL